MLSSEKWELNRFGFFFHRQKGTEGTRIQTGQVAVHVHLEVLSHSWRTPDYLDTNLDKFFHLTGRQGLEFVLVAVHDLCASIRRHLHVN